jgi:glutamate/tyrosine decarboxylase-like PLP-dependent enzyme
MVSTGSRVFHVRSAAQLGRNGLAQMIDDTCRHARSIVERIGNLPGVQVLWTPKINQGLLRFLSDADPQTSEQHDARTDQVIARVVRSGEAFFGPTTRRGIRAMRVSVLNWRTCDVDVERAVRAVGVALEGDHF